MALAHCSWHAALEGALGNPALELLDLSGDYLVLRPCWKSHDVTGHFPSGCLLHWDICPGGCLLWVLKWYTPMSNSLIHQTLS